MIMKAHVCTVNKCTHIKFVETLCVCVVESQCEGICVCVPSLSACSKLISQGVSISLRAGAGCYRDSSASLLPLPCCQGLRLSHYILHIVKLTPLSLPQASWAFSSLFLSWITFHHLLLPSKGSCCGSSVCRRLWSVTPDALSWIFFPQTWEGVSCYVYLFISSYVLR